MARVQGWTKTFSWLVKMTFWNSGWWVNFLIIFFYAWLCQNVSYFSCTVSLLLELFPWFCIVLFKNVFNLVSRRTQAKFLESFHGWSWNFLLLQCAPQTFFKITSLVISTHLFLKAAFDEACCIFLVWLKDSILNATCNNSLHSQSSGWLYF